MDTDYPRPAQSGLHLRHWVFIGSVLAMDFAFGLFFKSMLHASGITNFVRLDMAVPVVLMMLTRLIVDRFGVLTAYELSWAALALFALPGAMLPGPLKLIPALFQGLLYDAAFSLLRRFPRTRVFAAAILGGLLGSIVLMLLRVWVLDLPWATLTKALFGIQAATSIILNAVAASVALLVWARIRDLQITRMLRVEA